jgi:hypothetical protein
MNNNISLNKKKSAAEDDLDNLIFNDKKNTIASPKNAPQSSGVDIGDKKTSSFDRNSLTNVIPMDKIKHGANTASKYVLLLTIQEISPPHFFSFI